MNDWFGHYHFLPGKTFLKILSYQRMPGLLFLNDCPIELMSLVTPETPAGTPASSVDLLCFCFMLYSWAKSRVAGKGHW